MARGRSRSDSIQNVISNVNKLADRGVKEIVLTGVNLGDFGKDASGNRRESTFFDLVRQLNEVRRIDRFRISSIEPNLLSWDIIELVARSERFMPHFHIPLQSGSNEVLGLMRRRYKRELYAEKIAMIKSLMPHCAIGVDVIVGFPSESAIHFNETYEFLQELDVSYLHVFTYSEREGTKAVAMNGVVPVNLRHERNKVLRQLSYQKMQEFTSQHRGATRKVLFEDSDKNGLMEGYSDNYIRVSTPYRSEWANRIVDWVI
jgi:threonylcarbamoyladenosine tRNA methylthiotransferase MtaB